MLNEPVSIFSQDALHFEDHAGLKEIQLPHIRVFVASDLSIFQPLGLKTGHFWQFTLIQALVKACQNSGISLICRLKPKELEQILYLQEPPLCIQDVLENASLDPKTSTIIIENQALIGLTI